MHKDTALRILVLALLAGCTPTPEPLPATPQPSIQVIRVTVPGEMSILLPAIDACEIQVAGAGLLVFDDGGSARPEGPFEVVLRFGAPVEDGLNAALLGFERFHVITGADNPLVLDDEVALIDLLSGAAGGGPGDDLVIWIPQTGTTARQLIDERMGSAGYSPDAFLAPAAEAALSAVRENPEALAVVPGAWMTPDVRSVFTLGEVPVLALTEGPPDGPLRAFIGCLQLNPVYGESE